MSKNQDIKLPHTYELFQEIFDLLDIPMRPLSIDGSSFIPYQKRVFKEKELLAQVARALSSVDKEPNASEKHSMIKVLQDGESTLLSTDYSVFLSIKWSIKQLLENDFLRESTLETISKEKLVLDLIRLTPYVHFSSLALEHINKNHIKITNPFSGFNIAFFGGNDYDANNQKLLEKVGAKVLELPSMQTSEGIELFETNPDFTYKLSAEILLDALDNGADFVVVDQASHFFLFDNLQKNLEEFIGRDINLPILTPAQVVAISLGILDFKKLSFDLHKVKPRFLDK